MTWPRKLGVAFTLTGSLLLAAYLVPTLYGSALEHLAIAQFRAQSSANRGWDSARIRAFQRTLAVKLPPPQAVLKLPRVGLEVPVLEGVDELTLNRGAGHIPGTSLPGQPGNVAIAGHRDGFFRVLKDVVPGDVIEVQRSSTTDRYLVRNILLVVPSDTSVFKSTSENTLTLVTCYPFHYVGAAPQRYIVQATLIPSVQSTTGA